MIKNTLKRFVPVNIALFNRCIDIANKKIDRLNAEIIKNNSKVEDINIKVEDIKNYANEMNKRIDDTEKNTHKKIEDEFSVINEKLSNINKEVEKVNKIRYWNNPFERRVISSFDEMYQRPDFLDHFLELIRDMDKEETAKIVRILQRQRIVLESGAESIDLYLAEEQETIKEMEKYFRSNIFKVTEDVYCYENYLLPRKSFEPSVFYFKHGIEDLNFESIEYIKGKDIVDVGGYYGDSVLVLEELKPRRVFTFEAISENFEILKKTMELNKIENCIAEKYALSDREGETAFKINGSMSKIEGDTSEEDKTEVVKVTTLDKYVKENNLNVGLIKVDIEGAEQLFLKGAKETIIEQKPVLLLSIYHNADDFFNIKPIIESWNLGYKFKIHKPCDYSISREVLLIAEVL